MVCIIRVTENCPALTLSHPYMWFLVRTTCWIPMILNHEQLSYSSRDCGNTQFQNG